MSNVRADVIVDGVRVIYEGRSCSVTVQLSQDDNAQARVGRDTGNPDATPDAAKVSDRLSPSRFCLEQLRAASQNTEDEAAGPSGGQTGTKQGKRRPRKRAHNQRGALHRAPRGGTARRDQPDSTRTTGIRRSDIELDAATSMPMRRFNPSSNNP
ncbi:hypothetical protein BWP39_20635 [Paraburkholderia acidicola]|uniref:Uncharacterized protein n=1 Tax=Paraburkholderia acidicola TaxID=1912599 RepID=A0A2A4ELY7_9BURK|nr:hypothetical protein BWP39_20635 [Paraburkholderia acidicola]